MSCRTIPTPRPSPPGSIPACSIQPHCRRRYRDQRPGRSDAQLDRGTYTIVWQWSFWNHLVQNYLPSGETFYTNSAGQTVYVSDYSTNVNNPYLLNANCGSHTIQFFNHVNGIDYNASLDRDPHQRPQCVRDLYHRRQHHDDQAATGSGGTQGHGGDFLYRWGNDANYGGTGAETLFQQHNAQWIASGLPGAGDILIFNDGDNRTPQYTASTKSRRR